MTDKERIKILENILKEKRDEIKYLQELINNPEIQDFVKGVMLEASHQRERWGKNHDMQKSPEDWFWTLGYLAGKALQAQRAGNQEKYKHHLISSAALLANYHRQSINDLVGRN